MKQVKPMGANALATEKREQYYNDPNYIAERKYDGSRYILQVAEDGIYLTSRRESVKGGQVDKTHNVPQIIKDAERLPVGTILDGEIDVRGEVRNFKFVQGVMGSKSDRAVKLQYDTDNLLVYKVFDVLEFGGKNFRDKTLHERKQMLGWLFTPEESEVEFHYIEMVEVYQKDFQKFFDSEIERGAEGIMLKNLQSIYQEDKTPAQTWYKVKGKDTYDGIVMGYDYGDKGTKYETWLGTLRVYQYCNGVLLHTSDVGGLTEQRRKNFKEILDRGEQFCIEFEAYGCFEDTHKYRHPSFKRVREDKNPNECIYGKA